MLLETLFSEDTWALWGLLGTLLGTLLLVAALLWSGARVNEQARALWRSVRGQRAAICHDRDADQGLCARLSRRRPQRAAVVLRRALRP